MLDLERFRRAQDRSFEGFETALEELRDGRKRSHWIWYIFPQLSGLGTSSMSVRFALGGEDEAAAYLRDPLLRERLIAVTGAVVAQLERHPPAALTDLMGSETDVLKLVSSMTLFREAARRAHRDEGLPDAEELAARADIVLRVAAEQGYPPCAVTRRQLGV
jgi:uncharacterized protein (DUF1810 family)